LLASGKGEEIFASEGLLKLAGPEAVTTLVPSGENATLVTPSLCRMVARSLRVVASTIRATFPTSLIIILVPSGENAAVMRL